MKKITLLLLLVAFAISSFAQKADSVNVTFNVDFKPFIESPYDTVPFDADNDSVYISGGFAGWSEPGTADEYLMTDADDDSVYTLTVKLKMDSTYYYKFFYVPADSISSWEYGDFAGFDNRILELGSSDTTLNKAFSHFMYELTVKDAEQDTGLAGASVAFEDSTSITDSQGKIQRLLIHDSTFHYTVKADNGFIDKEAELNFGHFPTQDTMMMEPLYVTLNVNMKTFADTSSEFVYGEDSVYVSGVGGDWSQPGTNMDYLMKDHDGDSIFTTKVQVDSGATEYKYSYVPAGEGSSWDYGEWDGGDNRTLDVPNKSISVFNTWGIEETTYNVSFMVTDTTGMALADAKLMLGDDSIMTNSAGEAAFSIVSGDYDYMVSKLGYTSISGSLTVDKDTTIKVELTEMIPVTFSVTDTAGTAIEAATVHFAEEVLTTDADGYASKYVLSGEYDWKVTADDYVADSGTVNIDQMDTLNIELEVQTYTVTFNVMDESENPIDGAEVTVGSQTATTFGDGAVEFDLANGSYDYTVTADDYEDESGSVTVDGEAVTENVMMTSTSTSINNPLAKQLKVYPNPSDGNITLEGANIEGARVSILNSIGKQVKQMTLDNNTNYLHLDELKSGIYFIKIEDNDNEAVRKVLIK